MNLQICGEMRIGYLEILTLLRTRTISVLIYFLCEFEKKMMHFNGAWIMDQEMWVYSAKCLNPLPDAWNVHCKCALERVVGYAGVMTILVRCHNSVISFFLNHDMEILIIVTITTHALRHLNLQVCISCFFFFFPRCSLELITINLSILPSEVAPPTSPSSLCALHYKSPQLSV